MKTNALSTALASLYTRNKNRIMFRETYSLNELAFMIGESTHDSFDASALSKVLTGKRLFTARQLSLFSRLLKLPKHASDTLERSLAKDILSREHVCSNVLRRKSPYTRLLEYLFTQGAQFVPSSRVSRYMTRPEQEIISLFFRSLHRKVRYIRQTQLVTMDSYAVMVRELHAGNSCVLFSLKPFLSEPG